MRVVQFSILGEPASKANSRRLVTFKNKKTGKYRPGSIKSEKALSYVEAFKQQCPCHQLLEGDLFAIFRIYYASRRPDLDESVILDSMQGHIYANDRQVKRRYTEHALDPDNPRTEIVVGEMPPNQDSWVGDVMELFHKRTAATAGAATAVSLRPYG